MTQEIGLHLGHNLLRDIYRIGTFRILDVMIEEAVMAIMMRIHLVVVKNHNRLRVLVVRDQWIGAAIGRPTDPEMLLHSSHRSSLPDQSIRIMDD
jgi:hypothetical protein